MMITISPVLVQWLLISAASFCTFMIGFSIGKGNRLQVIESTIMYLIENNYVKSRKRDGEIDIVPLNYGEVPQEKDEDEK